MGPAYRVNPGFLILLPKKSSLFQEVAIHKHTLFFFLTHSWWVGVEKSDQGVALEKCQHFSLMAFPSEWLSVHFSLVGK